MNDRASFHDLPALHDVSDATSSASSAWLPLSDAQRAVWLDLQLGADPLAYLLAGRVRLDGELDFELLAQSLRVLSGRHDALRLQVDAHQPRQRLIEVGSQALPFFEHDLSARTPETVDAALEQLMSQKLSEPLLLGESVLFQVDLVKLSPTCHELLWRFHHLIADVTTITLVVARWAQTYAVLAGDVAMDLPPGSSFVATLASDAAYRASPQAEQDLAYWRRRFDDVPALVLPRRSGGPHPAHAPKTWSISGAEHAQWHASCAKAGVTEQRALVALLALALGTRHDRRDLTVGMALHRRDRQTLGVVGMMAAALPVRCQWQADDSLRQAVRGIAEQLDQDYRHQRAPIDAIGRALNLGQRGQPALFDLSISYTVEEAALTIPAPGGVRMTPRRVVPAPIVALPVLAVERPTEKRLDFELGWNPEHLSPAQADSVIAAFQRLLQQFCQQPNLPVAELEPCSPAEHTQILEQFNRPPEPLPALMLHQRFRAQAAATPNAPALVDGERTLSYAELDQRSDALARRLRRALHDAGCAAQPEPVVGVALPRSADTVVALLAILKAGAVYLPLDTAYPLQRLQYLLDDAQAALLIDAHGPDSPTATLNATRVAWTDEFASDDVLDERLQPERLAYVIYTSGSTGQPKPVGMSHRATLNLDHARQAHDPIGPGDRVLAAISVGFDVSIGQLLLPLLRGATIVIAPALRTLEAEQFWGLLAQHGVTHINSVPSFFDTVSEALMHQPEARRYRGLKQLMVGGEALSGALAAKLQQRLPGTRLVNMYGPTETCIDATAYIVPDARHTALPTMLPIGSPLPNYRAYVLDSLGRLLPPGVPGELCIGGSGLARGYLGRPDATAEKFTADPFAEHFGAPGARLYRTGDVACWREDGQIEFLGRNDHQVKIRGHRIETGEIEEVLLQHEAVQQAAVIARKDSHGQARLYGYVVPKAVDTDGAALTQALPAWLAERLPEHMVPSALVCLPALPLTTNGKLDLRALPAPQEQAQGRSAYVAPEGERETALATLWAELLQAPQVGRDDEFFALGGHSLLAITLVERLRQAGWHLPVTTIFRQPRLRDMAQACQSLQALQGGDTPASAVPPLGIPQGAQHLTPEMLPMVTLPQAQLDALCATLPGGAAQVQDILPLLPLQEGMLFHHLMQPHGDVFLSPVILELADRAAVERFVAALRDTVARHDILRTSFAWEGLSAPVQIVWREVELPLQVLDTTETTETDAALTRLKAALDPHRARLDVRQAPLLRLVASADPAQGRWLLGLQLHHLTLDHTSTQAVMAEVMVRTQTPAPALASTAPPVPWRELVWHALHDDSAEAQRAFFTDMLADVHTPSTPFGLAPSPASAAAEQPIGEAVLPLPFPVVAELRACARAQGVSVASVLHLAWGLVLAQAQGEGQDRDKVVFGTVLLGRLRAAGWAVGAESSLGMLINTLPLRVEVGGLRVDEALQHTHQRLAQLLQHEHAPLALAQSCSGVPAPTPLFNSLFNYRQSGSSAPSAGLSAAPHAPRVVFAEERSGYPLTLSVDDDGEGLQLLVQSAWPAQPQWLAHTVAHAIGHLVQALQQAPYTPCEDLHLLAPQERERVLHSWNDTAQAYPTGACLHTLFEAQAARTPEAVAVLDEHTTLRYAELNAQANRLAHHLLTLGVQPDSFVGLALERSTDMVAAILATQKAGGAYVPLDPDYPAERLRHMLQDCAPRVLLTQTAVWPRLAALVPPGTQVLCLDGAEQPWLAAPDHNLDPATLGLHAQHLAYLIYTSGSTGKPKGVMNEHAAVVNRIQWMQQAYGLQPHEAVLQKTPFSFDVSVWEFFWPLLYGARLVMARPQGHKDPAYLRTLIDQHGISTLHFVPSMLQVFLESLDSTGNPMPICPSLRRIVCSGEALPSAVAQRCLARLPHSRLHNLYGPTEAAVDVSYHACVPGGETLPGVPIGRPIANTRLYVLDARLQPVPVGVPGELYIGGVQVARGYWNRPDLTAERFLADPFVPAGRVYKTGDLVRWLPSGEIEFLGRNDHQVKLRGLRIELGEIEAALLQRPEVREAVVVARQDGHDAQSLRLVAYFSHREAPGAVSAAPQALIQHLKHQLSQTLPEYMVPSAWVALPHLPLSPNGKIDRQALPAPESVAAADGAARAYVGPRDALDARLQAVWNAVFERAEDAPIGLDDDFFALGGHSLRAVRLLAQCQAALRELGLAEATAQLNLRQLLQQPTLRAMADALRGGAAASPAAALSARLVPLRTATARRGDPIATPETPLFCIHPHNGLAWCYVPLAQALGQGHAQSPGRDLPVWGLQARGLEVGETPHTQVEDFAAEYLAALRQVQPQGPYRLLGYSAGGVIAHEMTRQLQQAGEHVEWLALLDAPCAMPHTGSAQASVAIPSAAQTLQEAAVLLGAPADAPPPEDASALHALMVARGLAEPGSTADSAQRLLDTAAHLAAALQRHVPSPLALPATTHVLQVHALRRPAGQPSTDWTAVLGQARTASLALDTDHLGLVHPDVLADIAQHVLALSPQDRTGDRT